MNAQNEQSTSLSYRSVSPQIAKSRKKQKTGILWGRLILFMLMIILFRLTALDWEAVPTASMRPAVIEGDRIFVNRLAYHLWLPLMKKPILTWSTPKLGDVVAFYGPKDHRRLVKRVVGLPGETIEVKNDKLIIDHIPIRYTPDKSGIAKRVWRGEEFPTILQENFPQHPHYIALKPYFTAYLRNYGPITLKQNQYFLMGDNRDYSEDSRYFGPVTLNEIIGRVSRVFYSEKRDGRFLRAVH